MSREADTREIDGLVRGVAVALDGKVTRAGSWFDGFWDFYVDNRERFGRERCWEVQGATELPWALEILAPGAIEVHVFVEAKDRRRGVRAPWPVASAVIGSGEAARVGPKDTLDRPHDESFAREIEAYGYVVEVGYWGVHCVRVVKTGEDLEQVSREVRDVILAAIELGRSLGFDSVG